MHAELSWQQRQCTLIFKEVAMRPDWRSLLQVNWPDVVACTQCCQTIILSVMIFGLNNTTDVKLWISPNLAGSKSSFHFVIVAQLGITS